MTQHKLLALTGRNSGLLLTVFSLLPYIGFVVAWLRPLWVVRMLIAGAILLAFYFKPTFFVSRFMFSGFSK